MKVAKIQRSSAYKKSTVADKLNMLLEVMSFEDLLEEGILLDVQGMAAKTGYTPQHIRVLCRQGKLTCIRRGYGAASAQAEEEFQYFFLREQVSALFSAE